MQQETQDSWRQFLTICTQIKSEEDLREFFDLFLTYEEKEDLVRRFLLVKELLKGEKTQREIAKDLSLSISKITRGSNALKIIRDGLREFLIKQMF